MCQEARPAEEARHFPGLPLSRITAVTEMAANYGDHALTQRHYVQTILPTVLEELEDGASIYDYGSADGVNAMFLARGLFEKTMNFSIGLVDLPTNSWDVTRRRVLSTSPRIFPETCAFEAPVPLDIQALARPRATDLGPPALLVHGNFYNQIVASTSVNIGVSTTAVHFLSSSNLPMVEQAAIDWMKFLRAREAELVSGGLLLVTVPARQVSEEPRTSYARVNEIVRNTLLQASKSGLITEQKLRLWRFPVYHRSTDQLMHPFAQRLVEGLYVESLSLVGFETPYWGLSDGSREGFADMYIPSVMAWLGPYMARSLGRSVHDLFKANLRYAIMNAPEHFKRDSLQAVMKIRKAV